MPEQPLPSTTWAWKRVKIARPPEAKQHRPAKRGRWWYLQPWPRSKPLPMTVKYRGGPECWYEIHGRGSVGRFPGHTALHDVMSEIMRMD